MELILIVWFEKKVASTDIVRLDEIVQEILSYAIFILQIVIQFELK